MSLIRLASPKKPANKLPHKIVREIKRAILNPGMDIERFHDIVGAFDNVTFSAIEKAVHKKSSSSTFNR